MGTTTTNEPRPQNYHFVISAPRSGSTWLARALNQHPEILCTESRLYGRFFEIWKNSQGTAAPRITVDEFARCFARHSFFQELGFGSAKQMANCLQWELTGFLADFLRQRSGKSTIVDKVTPYLGTADRVLHAISQQWQAKLVHLIRDGRDVAVSGVFDWVAREAPTSPRYRLFVKRDSAVRLPRFFDDELLVRWASYWTEPLLAFQRHAPPYTLEVRYESMLRDQATELDCIFRHLQVASGMALARSSAAASTFEKTTGRLPGQSQPLSKDRKGISGDWRNYFTRTDAVRFQQLTGNWLQQLQYEADTQWVESCPEHLDLGIDD